MAMKGTAEASTAASLAQGSRVAIIAGSGRLPVDVAASVAANGRSPFVISLDGEVDAEALQAYPGTSVTLESFASIPAILRREAITHVVLAGGVSRRPDPRRFPFNLSLLRLLARALNALRKGDDGLLRAVVKGLEEEAGVKVVGAHEVAPDLLAAEGPLTTLRASKGDIRDIEAGLAAARAIGALDIGQAAVAVGGRAIALEGIEGTDGLLERVRLLRDNGRIRSNRRGVLVKCPKPGQELRADLPAIGPATVDGAHAAGLAGIAVEAERTLILDHDAVVARANELGLFVVGVRGEAVS